MDHVDWVTMTDKGPIVANLILNGIFDKKGGIEEVKDFLVYRPRPRLIKGEPKEPEEKGIAK